MAINLDKSTKEKLYFYEDRGNTYGPFTLSVLLTKINSDTLVFREGIDWTIAKEIPELKNHFVSKKIIEKKEQPTQTNTIQPIIETKKSNNGGLWAFIILLIVAGIGYYFYNQYHTIANENTAPIDSAIAEANTLSDYEIFDIEAIRNYKPTDEQKIIASGLFEEAKFLMSNQNFTEVIFKLKESLKNSPEAKTYFQLADAYLKTNDFDRSEQCLQLSNYMDYQPKSDLDNKLILIHLMQGNLDVVTTEINNQIAINKNYLTKLEEDTLFYSYRQTENYFLLIEKNAIFDSINEKSIYPNIIANYYQAINNKTMDADDFYSENVNLYITTRNTNPSEINEIINSEVEYVDEKVSLIGSRVIISAVNSRQAWINYSCYRTSRKQFQTCRIKVEFIFNEQNEITSYKQLLVRDLKFKK